MNRQNLLIVAAVLMVAFGVYTYWPSLQNWGRGKTDQKGPAASAALPAATASPESAALMAARSVVETPPSVDPFARRVAVYTKAEIAERAAEAAKQPAGKPSEPKLEGIWVDSGRRVAFISSQAVSVGGQVMGWTVTSIMQDRVVLVKNSQVKILKMEEK